MELKRVWSNEWPTESGWYWFYGNPFAYNHGGRAANLPDALYAAYSHVNIDTGNAYIVTGEIIMYRSSCRGVWQPMVTPELPKVENV